MGDRRQSPLPHPEHDASFRSWSTLGASSRAILLEPARRRSPRACVFGARFVYLSESDEGSGWRDGRDDWPETCMVRATASRMAGMRQSALVYSPNPRGTSPPCLGVTLQ